MLHALARAGKSNRWKAYRGWREDRLSRDCLEDELTSAIFGPLDWLRTEDQYEFILHLLRQLKVARESPSTMPADSKMQFWPSRKALHGLRIEPDLQMDFFWRDAEQDMQHHLMVLIEVKWKSGLSGREQMERQWQEYLSEDERKNCIHILLAYDKNQFKREYTHHADAEHRPVFCSWADVKQVLMHLKSENAGFAKWIALALPVLEKIGIANYHGFDFINNFILEDCCKADIPIFWQQVEQQEKFWTWL